MSLSGTCDPGINGQYCDRPATMLGLSASAPDMWFARTAGVVSSCCSEHAAQEPRPTREQAENAWADVTDMCGGRQYTPADAADAWQRLLSAHPAPLPLIV